MADTFDPLGNGWKLQRPFESRERFISAEDVREIGNVTSVLVAEKPIRMWNLKYITDQRTARDYAVSFFRRVGGPVGRFTFALPEPVAAPDAAPTLTSVVSGTQSTIAAVVSFAWKSAAGVTTASPVGTFTVPTNELLKVDIPFYPPGITAALIYATAGAAGTEVEQVELDKVRTWTQPDAALLTGTDAPVTVNGATDSPTCRAVGDVPYTLTRFVGNYYELTLEIEEKY